MIFTDKPHQEHLFGKLRLQLEDVVSPKMESTQMSACEFQGLVKDIQGILVKNIVPCPMLCEKFLDKNVFTGTMLGDIQV